MTGIPWQGIEKTGDSFMTTSHTADYDVIAVGAGFAGISLSYHLREAGLNTKIFDRADDIGGTWT